MRLAEYPFLASARFLGPLSEYHKADALKQQNVYSNYSRSQKTEIKV